MAQQSIVRTALYSIAWTVLQIGMFLLTFELGRSGDLLSGYWTEDPQRAFFWQYYFFLFSGLVLIANVWVERHGLERVSSRRIGVWAAVLLVLAFFSRTHSEPRTAAVCLMGLATFVSIMFREIAARLLRRLQKRSLRKP